MTKIYKFNPEQDMRYWSYSDDFMPLMQDEIEPLIEQTAKKLTDWLKENANTYPDFLLSFEALFQYLHYWKSYYDMEFSTTWELDAQKPYPEKE